jgi:hypothetical protein
MRRSRQWSIALIALLALSCASANKLSQRSERELAAGDLPRAYQHARSAVMKSPSSTRAQAAFLAAATRVVGDRKRRLLAIAGVDTVAAARQLLPLTELRAEIARLGALLPPDTAFGRQETAIRIGAAGIRYADAERELSAHRPKGAWAAFRDAAGFASGYRDVGQRIDDTYELAVARVAILPPADQAGVPGLSRALADRIQAEVGPHIGPDGLRFTRLVDPALVYGTLTVARQDSLEGEEAARLGRRIGASQVVTGRIYGMRGHTVSTDYSQTIYRKITQRDTSGVEHYRYEPHDFRTVVRDREVSVHYDLQVLGVDDEATLAAHSDQVSAYARVVFSDFEPEGDCNDYCLVPPDLKRSDPLRAKLRESEWKARFGTWTLPKLLERARKEHKHERYGRGDRQAFFANSRDRPVWLGELPGEDELAMVALDVIWQPVLGMLQELDAK